MMANGMRWVMANEVVSRVVLSGAGNMLLVLIHEMGGTLESWDLVVDQLGRHRRILRYDVRGAGLSQKFRGTLAISDLTADLAAILEAAGAPPNVALLGTAVGGAIALQFAADYPDHTAAVIATSPATGIAVERRAATLARVDELEREGFVGSIDERLARSYPPVLRTDPEKFERVKLTRLAADPVGMAATFRMLAGLEMDASLARITAPTLILAGEHDGDRPPAGVAAVAAKVSGAQFKTLPSGHFMALQTPELLVDEIEAFLRPLDL
ncbi:MAG: alpha/beta fold hydrolase [Bradyrhizobium sp.]|uniref:alpha/beta fold hydrolase n=1 Tax=Bradyrhizobium sp. TaxID=376 RepID=UPI001DC42E3D|nr:alpha/beta hydrolase [Bradyrhizobium sp.]MBV9561289.1 alpha/beta fold hydrolase [Bradyrhizobium sp.]